MKLDVEELLNTLAQYGEPTRIDAKEGREIGPSIHQTVCAFANEPHLNGGFLLLGVAEDRSALFPVYQVRGVPQPEKLANELTAQCASVFSSVIRPQIEHALIDGKVVLGVYIPEAQTADKPIYIKKQGLPKGAYRRIGSGDVSCTDDDLQVLYQGRSSESFDYSLVPDGELDDFDPAMLEEYRRNRAKSNASAAELDYSDLDLLKALSSVRRDPKGEWKPTVSGILLFGTSLALRRHFPMMRVDYIRVKGKDWLEDPDQRFFSLDMRFPLMQVVDRAQAAIFEDLPIAFSLPEGSLQREDKPLLPARAIREAVVNAVMHRNYRTHSPIQIIRYNNRLEIRNVGFSLLPEEHLGEPQSQQRNPKIAAVLHDTRYAEQKGSGIGVMRRTMQAEKLSPPLFDSDRGLDRFAVTFLFHHFLNERDLEWLSRWSELDLSDDDRRALVAVRETGSINNAAYRSFSGVETLVASRQLKKLCDHGLLEMKPGGNKTFYEGTPELLYDSREHPKSAKTSGVHQEPSGVLDSSPSAAPGLTGMSEGLTGKLRSLTGKPEDLAGKLLAEVPEALQAQIQTLGQRSTPQAIRSTILALCDFRAYPVDELALLLRRQRKWLLDSAVKTLVAQTTLERTLEPPNHPRQAYRTTAEGRAQLEQERTQEAQNGGNA